MNKPGLYPDGRTIGWIVAGGGASALFFFSSIIVPLIGSLLGILAPLPLIVLCLRRGWTGGALASFVAAFLIGIALKPMVALYFLVQFAMLGLVASALLEKRASFGTVLLVSSLAVATGFFLLIGAQAHGAHQGFFEVLKKPLNKNIQAIIKSYPGLSGAEGEKTAAMFRKMLSFLVELIPALIVIGSWVILLANFYLIDRFRLIPGRELLSPFRLNEWKAPDHLIWGVIVPGFAVFLLHGAWRMVGLNILIAALTIYFFQGLCVINHFFSRKNFPPLLKALFYFMLFVIQIVAVMVVLTGLLDMWMDFRRLSRVSEPPPDDGQPRGEDGDG